MFPPWAPFFSAIGKRGHCCAEQVPLRDDELKALNPVRQGIGHEPETLAQLFDQQLRAVEQLAERIELRARHFDADAHR